MKKILMLLAVLFLLLNVAGQASAGYFEDGHLIRVVYQYGGANEVVTDLGPSNLTSGSDPMSLSYTSNPFPQAGSATFPGTWSSLQVAYFVKTTNGVWVSGMDPAQISGNRKKSSFVSAVNSIYAAALANAAGGDEATLLQSDLQSYETMMNNGTTDVYGFFAGFTPNMDGEVNLGSINDTLPYADSYLFYYPNPDTAASGTKVALLRTFADGTTDLEVGSFIETPHYIINLPATATAGTTVTGQLAAVDDEGYLMGSYAGTVDFTSTDPNIKSKLPKAVKIKNGVASFTVTLNTAGLQIVHATETSNVPPAAAMVGTTEIVIIPAVTKSFVVSAPATATTWIPVNFTVTAKDAFNNTVTGYAGTLRFTSSDKLAALPSDSTLSNGVGTFSATFKTGGLATPTDKRAKNTITATDLVVAPAKSLGKGTSGNVLTTWAATHHLTISAAPIAPAVTFVAGAKYNVTVTAYDAGNHVAAGFADKVHFTTTDTHTKKVLPADAALKSGIGTFAVTLATAGGQTVTATDAAVPALTVTSSSIAVTPGALASFVFGTIAPQTSNVPFTASVTAKDAFNNTVTSYTGSPVYTSNDATAVMPASAPFVGGTLSPSFTLKKKQATTTITATDGLKKGTSAKIVVN